MESITQLGADRIIDMQFGINEATYHIILELYDRGNVILTDYQYVIVSILRPFIEGEDVKYVVREKYPLNRVKDRKSIAFIVDNIEQIIKDSKNGDNLKKKLLPHLGILFLYQ